MKEHLKLLRQLQEIDHEIVLMQRQLASQSAEDSTVNGKLSQLREKKIKLAENIEHSFLLRYEKLRSCLSGSVLALAEREICKGCNMRLPARLYYEVENGTGLCTCPNCHRILFMASNDNE